MGKKRAVLTRDGVVEVDAPISPAKGQRPTEGVESPLFKRETKARKRKPKLVITERVVDEALQAWAEYLRAFFLPREAVQFGNLIGTVFECPSAGHVQCSGHSDPTLAAILQDERDLWAWPKTIHAMIGEMDKPHRVVMLGSALGVSQESIAGYLKCGQQWVSKLLVRARRSLLLVLIHLDHVRKSHESRQREIDREIERHERKVANRRKRQ